MTRGKVLLIGLAIFISGWAGYKALGAFGLEDLSAGIATQTFLVFIVLLWTGSYLFRVVTGQMTFMEQRRRYRKVYDEKTGDYLQEQFDALTEDEQQDLLRRIETSSKESSFD